MHRLKVLGKYAKAKQKRSKTEVKVFPKLRLEPRLTLSKSKEVYQIREDPKDCLEKFSDETTPQEETCYEKDLDREDLEQRHEFADEDDEYTDIDDEEYADVDDEEYADVDDEEYTDVDDKEFSDDNDEEFAAAVAAAADDDDEEFADEDDEDLEDSFTEKLTLQKDGCKRAKINKTCNWTDREKVDLAYGLQAHGFSDLKKIAEFVKTKNEDSIRQYLRTQRIRAAYNPDQIKINRQGNRWSTLSPDHLATWPNIRKWRKLAYEQMQAYTRSKDYSKPVLLALCKKFYEEEPEPSTPQVMNTKLIYKYILACMAGDVPPQLPPKESALVLDLLREVRSIPRQFNFEEERKFLQDFRSATTFKPNSVSDEFKKKYKVEESAEQHSSNAVPVPEEVFMHLSRHKQLVQSFNPLMIPGWMLQKEQEILEKYAAEGKILKD